MVNGATPSNALRVRIHLLGGADLGGHDPKLAVADRCADLHKEFEGDPAALAGWLAAPPTSAGAEHQPLGPLANAYGAAAVEEAHAILFVATASKPAHLHDTAPIAALFEAVLPTHQAAFGIEHLVRVDVCTSTFGLDDISTAVRASLSQHRDQGFDITGIDVVSGAGAKETFLGVLLGAMHVAPMRIVDANRHDREPAVQTFDLSTQLDSATGAATENWLQEARAFDALVQESKTEAERNKWKYWAAASRQQWGAAEKARRALAKSSTQLAQALPGQLNSPHAPNGSTRPQWKQVFDRLLAFGLDALNESADPHSARHAIHLQNWFNLSCQYHAHKAFKPAIEKRVLRALKDSAARANVPRNVTNAWANPSQAEWTYLIGHRRATKPIRAGFDEITRSTVIKFLNDREGKLVGASHAIKVANSIRHGDTAQKAIRKSCFLWVAGKLDDPPKRARHLIVVPVGHHAQDGPRDQRASSMAREIVRFANAQHSAEEIDVLLVATGDTAPAAGRIGSEIPSDGREPSISTFIVTTEERFPTIAETRHVVRDWLDTNKRATSSSIHLLCNPGTKSQNVGALLAVCEAGVENRQRATIAPIRSNGTASEVAKSAQTIAQVLHDRIIARVVKTALASADANLAQRVIDLGSTEVWRSQQRGIVEPEDEAQHPLTIEAGLEQLRQYLSHNGRPRRGVRFDKHTVARLTFWHAQASTDPALATYEAVAILERGGPGWRDGLMAFWNARNRVIHAYFIDAPSSEDVKGWINHAITYVKGADRSDAQEPEDTVVSLRDRLLATVDALFDEPPGL